MGFGKNTNLASLFAARAKLEAEIAAARKMVEEHIAPKLQDLEELNTGITALAVPLALAGFKKEYKADGTIRFASDNAIFKAVIGKTVSYDGDKLMEIINSIPWDTAKDIFKIKLDVGEKAYKAITDEKLKQRLTDARTVKYSDPKITEDT